MTQQPVLRAPSPISAVALMAALSHAAIVDPSKQPRNSLCHTTRAVGDRDLCLLNTMRYESEASSGSSCVGGIFNSDDGTCVPLPPYALRSGPRDTIYWEPKDVRAAPWFPTHIPFPSMSSMLFLMYR